MSAVDSWMPLYIGDFLADTTHLSAEEVGAYMLLLMNHWRVGYVPSNGQRLAKICRVSKVRWDRAVGPALLPFFDIAGDKMTQKRLVLEREKALKTSASRAGNALSRWSRSSEGVVKDNSDISHANATTPHMPGTTHARDLQSQSEDSPPYPPEGGRSGFGEFWDGYPVKVDQGHAERAWDQVVVDTDPATILAGLRRFRFGSDPPKPQAWLRAKRWADQADDPPAPRATSGPEPVAARVARAEQRQGGGTNKPGLVRILLANDWEALQAYEAMLREREKAVEPPGAEGGTDTMLQRGAA